jgi:anaerobic selenocysteine-containing dehydrogenase
MERRGLTVDDRVNLVTLSTDGVERVVSGFKVVPYQLPDGCCGAYDPEANPLIPLCARDPHSLTPSSKSIPVRLVRTGAAADEAGGKLAGRPGVIATGWTRGLATGQWGQ